MSGSSCCGPADRMQSPAGLPDGQIHEIDKGRKDDLQTEVCCGGAPPPRSDPFERPGYALLPYVRAFRRLGPDFVPLVRTSLSLDDHWGALCARFGINREDYRIAPGLYGIGTPGADSQVIVTANYKLTFDAVRKELHGLDVWLLVLDTCGINVWCAAGKKTFSTGEIVNRLHETGLKEKVNHRCLILPQLSAPGVAAHEVKRQTGFSVIYGPVRAGDLPRFLSRGCTADEPMRQVSFTIRERAVVIPVELTQFCIKVWWTIPVFMFLSGLGPWIFSLRKVLDRGIPALAAILAGGFAGTVLAPLFLPWLPGRSFALKGALTGLGDGPCHSADDKSKYCRQDQFGLCDNSPEFLSCDEFHRLHAIHLAFGGGMGDETGHSFSGRRSCRRAYSLARIAIYMVGGCS